MRGLPTTISFPVASLQDQQWMNSGTVPVNGASEGPCSESTWLGHPTAHPHGLWHFASSSSLQTMHGLLRELTSFIPARAYTITSGLWIHSP